MIVVRKLKFQTTNVQIISKLYNLTLVSVVQAYVAQWTPAFCPATQRGSLRGQLTPRPLCPEPLPGPLSSARSQAETTRQRRRHRFGISYHSSNRARHEDANRRNMCKHNNASAKSGAAPASASGAQARFSALVPYYMPDSDTVNADLAPLPPPPSAVARANNAPESITVRSWDHATGVFKDPVAISLAPCPEPARTANPVAAISPRRSHIGGVAESVAVPVNKRPASTGLTLLTPAAIAAARANRRSQSVPRPTPAPEPKLTHVKPVATAVKCVRANVEKTPVKGARSNAAPAKTVLLAEKSPATVVKAANGNGKAANANHTPRGPRAQGSGVAQTRGPSSSPARKTNGKYAGSSMEAASPSPMSIPMPRFLGLAGGETKDAESVLTKKNTGAVLSKSKSCHVKMSGNASVNGSGKVSKKESVKKTVPNVSSVPVVASMSSAEVATSDLRRLLKI